MLFNSVAYLLFFPLCILIYYVLGKYRVVQNCFLLLASYYFYANFEPRYLLLLLSITLVSYVTGLLLNRSKKNKTTLILSLLLLLSPLFFYKYFNFFNIILFDSLSLVGLRFEVHFLRLLLPIGISFYTFQAIGYVVDVYKQKIEVERNLLDYALFLGFFPQIASGPIGRASSILPQIKKQRVFNSTNLSQGFNYLLWGYFLKLVIADRGGIYVDAVFNNYLEHSGISLILATFIYSFQIYGDFAGYSLMALGSAKMMGFDLINNFRRPYFSKSVAEFWRRWHISLSTWFRDYVYIPLGGNRVSPARHNINIIVTFLVSGIWHGAAYNFILWGGLHGLFQVCGKYTSKWQDKVLAFMRINSGTRLYKITHIVITFVIVSYAWMIFRISDFNAIKEITMRYFMGGYDLFMDVPTLIYFFSSFLIFLLKTVKEEFFSEKYAFTTNPKASVRIPSLVGLLLVILFIGVLDNSQFIYFAF